MNQNKDLIEIKTELENIQMMAEKFKGQTEQLKGLIVVTEDKKDLHQILANYNNNVMECIENIKNSTTDSLSLLQAAQMIENNNKRRQMIEEEKASLKNVVPLTTNELSLKTFKERNLSSQNPNIIKEKKIKTKKIQKKKGIMRDGIEEINNLKQKQRRPTQEELDDMSIDQQIFALSKHLKLDELANKFNKTKEEITDIVIENELLVTTNKPATSRNTFRHVNTELKVLKYVKHQYETEQKKTNENEVRSKAKEFTESKGFMASNSWFYRLRKRFPYFFSKYLER